MLLAKECYGKLQHFYIMRHEHAWRWSKIQRELPSADKFYGGHVVEVNMK